MIDHTSRGIGVRMNASDARWTFGGVLVSALVALVLFSMLDSCEERGIQERDGIFVIPQ